MNSLQTISEKIAAFKSTRALVVVQGQAPLIDIGSDIPHPPASLAKLMTLYVALRAGDAMPATIPITAGAIHYDLNKYKPLKLNDTLPRDTSLDAMMTASDNVAATANAIALGHGKTDLDKHRDFVMRMNDTAKALGMAKTQFSNASGWPFDKRRDPLDQPAQTTAADMATLIGAIYRDFPKQAERYLESQSVIYKKVRHNAHHGLNTPTSPSYVGEENIKNGGKTGFTGAAGYNIVTMARNADGNQLTIVLLGVPPEMPLSKALETVGIELLPKEKTPSKQKDPMIRGNSVRDAIVNLIIKARYAITGREKDACDAPKQTPNLRSMENSLNAAPSDSVEVSGPLPTPLINKHCLTR